MNWLDDSKLNAFSERYLAGPGFIETLESRCLLSVNVTPPVAAVAAQPQSAVVQPAKHNSSSAPATLTGTYTGTARFGHTPKGFAGLSRTPAFTLTVGSETSAGATNGTFSVAGFADFTFSGFVKGHVLSVDLSGPGTGTLKATFNTRTLAFSGSFTTLLNAQKISASLHGGVVSTTPPTPAVTTFAPAPTGAGGVLNGARGVGATTSGTKTGSTTGTTTTTTTTTTTGTTPTPTLCINGSGIDTATTPDQSGIDTATTVDQNGIGTATNSGSITGGAITTATGAGTTTGHADGNTGLVL